MEPLVCAVMLTKDWNEMAKRAIECFRSQTYQNKYLLIWDTSGMRPFAYSWDLPENIHVCEDVSEFTIGTLRNRAIGWDHGKDTPQVMIHWDDDDWSHPNRIAEQVALLQASGKQAVGYRDMLFWRRIECPNDQCVGGPAGLTEDGSACLKCGGRTYIGEAWLYSNNDPRYCLGTSLCYWRAAWERRPFPDISRGEDKAWLREVDSVGVSSLGQMWWQEGLGPVVEQKEPRMIASIHSGNHVVYEPQRSPHNWKRVPEWDAHCRATMTL